MWTVSNQEEWHRWKPLSAPVTNLLARIFQFITLTVTAFTRAAYTHEYQTTLKTLSVLSAHFFFKFFCRLCSSFWSFWFWTIHQCCFCLLLFDSLVQLPVLKWTLHNCISELSLLSSAPWYIIGAPSSSTVHSGAQRPSNECASPLSASSSLFVISSVLSRFMLACK